MVDPLRKIRKTISITGGTGSQALKSMIGKIVRFSLKAATATTTFRCYLETQNGFRPINKKVDVTGQWNFLYPPVPIVGISTVYITNSSANEDFELEILVEGSIFKTIG